MRMGKNTSKDYRDAVRLQYEITKRDDVTGLFLDLTPAQLRNLCLIKYDAGLDAIDKEIFKHFFAVTNPEELRGSIFNFDITKFKAVQNFLNSDNKESSTSIINLNLIAVLIDFKARPWGKFRMMEKLPLQEEKSEELKDKKLENETLTIESIQSPEEKRDIIKRNEIPPKTISITTKPSKKPLILFGIILTGVVFFIVHQIFTAHKDCLEWKNDRYVEVDCDSKSNSFVNLNTKIPYNEYLLQIRKITPTDTTTYFKEGKAIIWYCKDNNGKLELFNSPGFHPETESPLKPITNYMINKYLE